MKYLMPTLLVLFSLLLSFYRIEGFISHSYQAFAHLFVGGLFGAYFVSKRWLYLILALGLTILETVCFVLNKFIY